MWKDWGPLRPDLRVQAVHLLSVAHGKFIRHLSLEGVHCHTSVSHVLHTICNGMQHRVHVQHSSTTRSGASCFSQPASMDACRPLCRASTCVASRTSLVTKYAGSCTEEKLTRDYSKSTDKSLSLQSLAGQTFDGLARQTGGPPCRQDVPVSYAEGVILGNGGRWLESIELPRSRRSGFEGICDNLFVQVVREGCQRIHAGEHRVLPGLRNHGLQEESLDFPKHKRESRNITGTK